MSQKNNPLELWVTEKLKELGEKYARPTRASGASVENGDVLSERFYVECKIQKSQFNCTILQKEWQKLIDRIPLYLVNKKYAIYVVENKNSQKFVCMDGNDFFDMIKEQDNA